MKLFALRLAYTIATACALVVVALFVPADWKREPPHPDDDDRRDDDPVPDTVTLPRINVAARQYRGVRPS